jgi:hypothetical protein
MVKVRMCVASGKERWSKVMTRKEAELWLGSPGWLAAPRWNREVVVSAAIVPWSN